MKYWTHEFKAVRENEKDVKAGIVAANSFGAATANMFRVISGLPSTEWGIQKEIEYDNDNQLEQSNEQTTYRKTKQKTLLDYTSN
jgi:hypothetical protein